MTFKIKEDFEGRFKRYAIYSINSKTEYVKSQYLSKEQLIDIAQQFNNELIPIIGEENLYERD